MEIRIGNACISVDIPATRRFHRRLPVYTCSCQNCVNYLLAIHQAPREQLETFDALGVDPARVLGMEAFQDKPLDGGVEYHGHTLLIGKIAPPTAPDDTYLSYEVHGVRFFIRREPSSYMLEMAGMPRMAMALAYVITLPWAGP